MRSRRRRRGGHPRGARRGREIGGCTFATAANGREALDWLEKRRPCLIILDLRMPVMTGGELLEILRADPALSEIPVVVSTSAPGRAPPGVTVLRKPVDLDALWSCMRDACRCAANAPGA